MMQDHWLPGFNFNVEEWFESERGARQVDRAADCQHAHYGHV
jgi:hypothetical protein